jgi:hypothetical protein
MTERMSKSRMPGSLSHFFKNLTLSASSAAKITTGIARSVVGAPCGRSAMMKRQARPASCTTESPRNSASRRAQEMAVDFCSP